MRPRRIVPIMLVLVAMAAVAAAGDLDFREEIDRTLPLAADGRISLDNVNGDLSVTVWDRDEVRILAEKRASSAEALERLEVVIDGDGSSVRIETRYSSGTFGWTRSERMEVEYTLSVPRGASLDGVDLVNGNLLVDGLEGEIEAESVNGTLELKDVAGTVEVSTVNGGIELWAGRIRPDAEVELSSVNGTVDLHLPPGIGATFEAETVNGSLHNDFGIEVRKGKYVGADMNGVVGSGEIRISLDTVNGSVRVHAD